jgi:hypothetical protein
MSALVDCPHCRTRVLPMAERRCPACRKNVDAAPDPGPTPEQVSEAAYGLAAVQLRDGVSPSEIQAGLTHQGLDAEAAATVVGNLKQVQAKAHKDAAQKNMLLGALWCIGGLVVTVATYGAASGPGGGRYVIAWGAIVFGAAQFVRGLIQSAGE